MTASDYALMMEKRLIDKFKQTFFDKVGYYPVVITRFEIDGYDVAYMPLDDLVECFTPFLPERYGKVSALDSKNRYRELVDLRAMFSFLAYKMKYPLVQIGKRLGNRDHSTVLHGLTIFKNQMETAPAFRDQFITILSHIRSIQNAKNESSILGTVQEAQHQPEPAILP